MMEKDFIPAPAERRGPPVPRRRLLALGVLGSVALALPGCATFAGFGVEDAVRRLLTTSSQRAFARLLAPGGFYENALARSELEQVLGARGGALETVLASAPVRIRLLRALSDVAARGAERAAPLVTDAVRTIGIRNALSLVRGGPTAATDFLRSEMSDALVAAMLPELAEGLRIISDPVIGAAVTALSGADLAQLAMTLAQRTQDAIWAEIGAEEARIRADPEETGDPLLIGVFGAG